MNTSHACHYQCVTGLYANIILITKLVVYHYEVLLLCRTTLIYVNNNCIWRSCMNLCDVLKHWCKCMLIVFSTDHSNLRMAYCTYSVHMRMVLELLQRSIMLGKIVKCGTKQSSLCLSARPIDLHSYFNALRFNTCVQHNLWGMHVFTSLAVVMICNSKRLASFMHNAYPCCGQVLSNGDATLWVQHLQTDAYVMQTHLGWTNKLLWHISA